jgi:SAM-dependent methyltransferase
VALPKTNTSESVDTVLQESIACPACFHKDATLLRDVDELRCSHCDKRFPLYQCGDQAIPWLFEYPELNLLEWTARLNGFLFLNQQSKLKLKEAQKDKRLSKIGQKRIAKLLESKNQQVEQVLEIISSLDLQKHNADELNNSINVLQSKTPSIQGLTSYYDNIFRDWSWENGENNQMLAVVDSVIPEKVTLGKVLTIGAGAGRLSYDIHQKYSPEYSMLIDINPLLLFAGCKVIQGDSFTLNEYPVAPLNKNSFFAEQHCKAPEKMSKNIYFMFADGMNPPVRKNSFDTVITPWLIDVIPQNLRDYIPRINACIPVGGAWINTGSLAFAHKQESWCYSEEELVELIEKNGFQIVSSNRTTINYMHSPLSAHGRTEAVFSFYAKKVKDVVVPPKYDYLPSWIKSTSIPIPKQYEQEIESSQHLLQAQVLGAIDGVKSIEQIGELLAKQYSLNTAEATHAVRRIMVDFHENN